MARLVKILLIVVGALIGAGVLASLAVYLFVDPNDFRDDISDGVRSATGRELRIEGDLGLRVFPWIAVEVGRTELGNAAGFGEEPFLAFDNARLSVRLLPLLLRRELAVGTATLDGLVVNLAVAADGRSNWEDLAAAGEAAAAETTPPPQQQDGTDAAAVPDVAGIRVSDASLSYADAQAGSSYRLSGLSLETGRIAAGEAFDLATSFAFRSQPDGPGGTLAMRGRVLLAEGFGAVTVDDLNVNGELSGIVGQPTGVNLDARQIVADLDASRLTLGEMDLGIFGLAISAEVEPFAYSGPLDLKAALRVGEFSLKELMQAFGTEPPQTADPDALTRVSLSANAAVSDTAIGLDSLSLELDDTVMTGSLSLPLTGTGAIRFDLSADRINVDPYMAPAAEGEAPAGATETGDVEIPADMIRALNAKGRIRLGQALLSGLSFDKLELGVDSAGGKLRLHPISAELFDGSYRGDVRIDASAPVPSISVDERIEGVSLTPLARAMFGRENVSGTIRGSFVLSGRGATLAAIQRDLDGTMSFALEDGEWQGTDIWHQIRAARALFRGEPAPAPREPPRTEFSNVTASGTVTDGIFRNDDLLAELPFLRLSGAGSVDLPAATIDYSLQARVVEKPEFAGSMSEAELADYTQAVIPLKISGPLAAPAVKPDVEALLRKEVEKKGRELRDRVLDSLLGGEEKPAEGEQEEPAEGEEEEPERSKEDELKDALKDIFKN